ncbi:hypothetical protein IK110_00490 [Candidatus Saccharibacteria bacterium]|nr:hypothetical protein [Candidatus Saccharibacteria bacterium]
MRKLKGIIYVAVVAILAAFLGLNTVYAEETTSITTAAELKQAMLSGGAYKLDADITMASNYSTTAETSLDLNGHTLNAADKTLVPKAKFTVSDSQGSGKITGTAQFKIQVGSSATPGEFMLEGGLLEVPSQYGIQVISGSTFTMNGGKITGDNGFLVYNRGTFVMNGGEIISGATGNVPAVRNNGGASFEMNGGKIIATNTKGIGINFSFNTTTGEGSTGVINGGEVRAESNNSAAIVIYKNADLTVNGGTIVGENGGIVGNGTGPGYNTSSEGTGAKVTVTGGNISSTHGAALYVPQYEGVTTISGGTISAEEVAVEIRAGTLNISGGTLIATADSYSFNSNDNGSTTVGAAVAVAQHVTAQPITVSICGGVLRGAAPFSAINSEGNTAEDTAKVDINIQEPCGELRFESTGTQAVAVDDAFTGFIQGGLYTFSVEDYLAEGYGERKNGEMYEVSKYHTVTIATVENGVVTVSKLRALKGEAITIATEAEDGYELSDLTAARDASGEVQIANNSFAMPDGDVVITAVFASTAVAEPEPAPTPAQTGETKPEALKNDNVELPNTGDDIILYVLGFLVSTGGLLAVVPKPRKE